MITFEKYIKAKFWFIIFKKYFINPIKKIQVFFNHITIYDVVCIIFLGLGQ